MGDPYKLLRKYVNPGELPPEFDMHFYRLVEDDMAQYSDQQILDHFEKIGKSEGRMASPAAHRYGLLHSMPPDANILEIGPFFRPACQGPNVKYFDVLSQQGLIDRAIKTGLPSTECPYVHFVSPKGDLSVVDERFDLVFSSHCIEHQPDPVHHLQQVAQLLNNLGRYYLVIPDKRYCIDYYIGESTTEEIVQAHKERRTVHAFKSVYEHCVMTTHNDQAEHWRGNHCDPRLAERAARADYAMKIYQEAEGGYIDVHAWQFTPTSFRNIMSELSNMEVSPFMVERVYETIYGQNEFTAVLKLR